MYPKTYVELKYGLFIYFSKNILKMLLSLTYLTIYCHKCLFLIEFHINQVGSVMVVESISDEVVHQKTLTRQAPFLGGSRLELLSF